MAHYQQAFSRVFKQAEQLPDELCDAICQLYCGDVWQELGCDQIQNQIIAELLFDCALATNTKLSLRLLQITLGLVPTGSLTDELIERVNQTASPKLISEFELTQLNFYCAMQTGSSVKH